MPFSSIRIASALILYPLPAPALTFPLGGPREMSLPPYPHLHFPPSQLPIHWSIPWLLRSFGVASLRGYLRHQFGRDINGVKRRCEVPGESRPWGSPLPPFMTCYLLTMFFECPPTYEAPYPDVCIVIVLNCVFCGSLHADRVPAHWKFIFAVLYFASCSRDVLRLPLLSSISEMR